MGFFSDLLTDIEDGRRGLETQLRPPSAKVDDFLRLTASANTPETRTLVSQVSELFKKIDFESKEISIFAPDASDPTKLTQLGRTVRGQDIVRRTAAAIVDPAAFSRLTQISYPEGAAAFQMSVSPGTAAHNRLMSFFSSEGVAFQSPENIDQFIIYGAELSKDGSGYRSVESAEKTFINLGHEITHVATDIGGARTEQELAQRALSDRSQDLRNISRQIDVSSVPLSDKIGVVKQDLPEMIALNQASARNIIALAQEEITAQTGALEFARIAGLSTTIDAMPLTAITGYHRPAVWGNYVSQMSEGFGPISEMIGQGFFVPEGMEGSVDRLINQKQAFEEWQKRMKYLGSAVYSSGMKESGSLEYPERVIQSIDSIIFEQEYGDSPGIKSIVESFAGQERRK